MIRPGRLSEPAGLVVTGRALSSEPAIPSHAPGPTPPGTFTLPPNRAVSNTSNATKPTTSSAYGALSASRRRPASAGLNRALDDLQEPASPIDARDSSVTTNSTANAG